MESINLSNIGIFNVITLFHIEIFAIIITALGCICIAGMIISRWKYTVKTKKHMDEIGDFGAAAENMKLTKTYIVFTRLAIVFFAIAMLSIIIYSIIFSRAKAYGAYGDFYRKNSLTEIQNNIQNGFLDQSKEVPDDPKGCVIIFFKWGCEDCTNIHDELLSKLNEYELFKTYFVSSKSERGQELLASYPMDSVPSGIYIYYDTSRGIDYQGHVLNDGTSLDEYNLDTLLSVQTYIRCFELPDEYAEDAIDKIPDKYTQTYEDESTEPTEGGEQ